MPRRTPPNLPEIRKAKATDLPVESLPAFEDLWFAKPGDAPTLAQKLFEAATDWTEKAAGYRAEAVELLADGWIDLAQNRSDLALYVAKASGRIGTLFYIASKYSRAHTEAALASADAVAGALERVQAARDEYRQALEDVIAFVGLFWRLNGKRNEWGGLPTGWRDHIVDPNEGPIE